MTLTQDSDGAWSNADRESRFAPTVTLDNHTFEFHESLPIVGNFPIPAEFARTPTGSSVYDPESVLEESGRTYHGYKDGKYFLPNDAAEQDRLDFQHAGVMVLFQGCLAFAPVDQPQYVLDIATGTGIWALEFARQNQLSTVIGTDLSSIQPHPEVPNCSFVKDDSEEEWLFNDIKFDYVHLRFVYTCFNDHKLVMKRAFDNMKPGAWIEYQDGSMEIGSMDGNLEGTAIKRMMDLCMVGAAAADRDLRVAKHFKEWLIEAGLAGLQYDVHISLLKWFPVPRLTSCIATVVDVVERKMIAPGNPWPTDPRLKRVGQYTLPNLRDGMRGIAYRMLKLAGLSPPEIEALCLEFQQQCGDPQYRWFAPIYVVYGRKPFEGEINGAQPPLPPARI